MLSVLDLFSGIGGFSLGLERTGGFRTVAFCEIDPYCRAVLFKHWPYVPIFPDVTKLRGDDVRRPAVICGGFPCQDVSTAGQRAGIDGARSGLWGEFARLIGELRPRYAIVENVPGLLSDGMGRVLGDLAALGYDAEWHCIPASALGAPHRRDRVWILANADQRRRQGGGGPPRAESELGRGREAVADPAGPGRAHLQGSAAPAAGARWGAAFADGCAARTDDQWGAEPDVGRVVDGVPSRVDRLRALGNAIVPQIAEEIGRAILAIEKGQSDGHEVEHAK